MLLIVITAIAALSIIGWIGLQVEPAQFDPFPRATTPPRTVPIPNGLPEPVDRFYRRIYPEGVPVIESAVVTGRASLRIKGISFPARFRFTHDAGNGYRHYIEATWFGLPVMKVNEHYLDGRSRLELPFGTTANSPKVDQAANIGMWAESVWFPAILLTDPRVHWAPVDRSTALLEVPFENVTERYVVRFDPASSLIVLMESMRYKEEASENKILWLNRTIEWKEIGGWLMPAVGTATWLDDGTPWATFRVEDVVYNADVQEYIRARGE
jgi:hypothetical protein